MERKVNLAALLNVYHVGSGSWSWDDEYNKLINRPVTKRLIESVRSVGIREPILLGNDGRVWDGHHRIVVARFLGIRDVPVEFSGEGERAAASHRPGRGSGMKPLKQIAQELWDEASDIKQYDKDAYSRICDLASEIHDLHQVIEEALGLTAEQEGEER